MRANFRKMIFVVDPAQATPELDSFNMIASMSPVPCSYHLPCLFGMKSIHAIPSSLIQGIIVLGSNASVNDRQPWQDAMNSWLLEKILAGVPTLGCCYGHQLIAHLFGGEIGFLMPNEEKLRGFRTTEVFADSRLNLPNSIIPLVISHREVVKRVPDELELWATSDICNTDGFRHQSLPVWTLQPHPEATPIFLEERGIPQPTSPEALAHGHEIVRAFLKFAASRA